MTRVLSGIQPTGDIHLGNYLGALRWWVADQYEHDSYHLVVDLHALTVPRDPAELRAGTLDVAALLLAVGLDPEVCTMFVQSHVSEHSELCWLLECVASMGELGRMTQFKDKAAKGGEEAARVGLFAYPVLQAADILLYRARGVPVGIDQVPHLELTREVARRFNRLYGEVFPEPEALLTETPKVPGTDGRKMSKSYNNAVYLDEPDKDIEAKLSRMATDPRRVRRTDPGEPADCPAFNLHRIYCTPEEIEYVTTGCRTAGIGCLDCKRVMIKHVLAALAPIRARRAELRQRPDTVPHVLADGNARARAVAEATMAEVREAMKI